MAKDNSRFFDKKQEWSKIKDELLLSYLPAYFQKVLYTHRPVFYVDCFAGMGVFKDGQPGSPVIALNIRSDVLAKTKVPDARIDMCFIDKNYEEELKQNTNSYPEYDSHGKKTIIGGKYEDHILSLLKAHSGDNIFLYIDPYGIKALDYDLFIRSLSCRPSSFEMLINMNSFGFIRAACRAMNISCDDIDVHDLVEYDSTEFDTTSKSIELLDKIAGGTYWREIVGRYRQEKAYDKDACIKAERAFSLAYKNRLQKTFAYVLDMPLRLKAGGPPKYRLVHVTNHPDGCILMADNMMSRAKELLVTVQNKCQPDLFGQDVDNHIVDDRNIYDKVKQYVSRQEKGIRLGEFMADFFSAEGVVCATGHIKAALKMLEEEKYIEVVRVPATTSSGRPSQSFEDGKGKSVTIRRS